MSKSSRNSSTIRFVKVVSPLAVAIALAACGGDSSFGGGSGSKDSSSTTKTSTTNNGTTNGGTGTAEPVVLKFGAMKIGLKKLSAGGSTGITVELKDQHGEFAKTEQTVTFSSPCISNGQSEIVSPIKSSTGVFTTTYTAKGCEGDDEITATSGALKTKGTVNVTPANLGAVEFVSAEPQSILLKGMSAAGQQHTSTVKFQIKNDVGGPIANADVKFELVTPAVGDGGIKLSTTTGKTDNNGYVSTILQAGTVHTSVRVRATVERNGTKISSESSQLVISTGIADQNSFSLSFSTLNPAAWDHDGVEVDVNVIASDRYNNPVPDGTTVSFYTELGQIQPSCQTKDGRCSVKWRSSEPRDLGIPVGLPYPRHTLTNASDGITTVTAKILGEESFIDQNANGIFDDGDIFDTRSDRGETYIDYNMGYEVTDANGNKTMNTFDQGLDPFILDYNGNGKYDPKDGKYTGLGCKHSSLCANDNGLKDIFTSGQIVMSEDNQSFVILDNKENPVPGALKTGETYTLEVYGVKNHQVPPMGTSISVSADGAKVLGGKLTLASTNAHGSDLSKPYGPARISFTVTEPEKNTGTVKISIDTGAVKQEVTRYFVSP